MRVSLATKESPGPSEVGGKGASLIRLRQSGFYVPDGEVLTTRFFDSWIRLVETTRAWQSALSVLADSHTRLPGLAARALLTQRCDEAKAACADLSLDTDQQSVLNELIEALEFGARRKSDDDSSANDWAVRSSSPEEDLAGTSFAGLYETVLDVGAASLERAVRNCFLSCLDARVLLYKREMNFDSLTPAIAVIVQRQIASDISGVAFSLNPLTNDFDEALINAGWGFGEALVSGEITPDRVLVDKVSGTILEYRAGHKGGDRSEEQCLDETRIAELTDAIENIERLYQGPVDVEWAIADDQLHILQARPVTAYVPLAKEMQTAPGAPRYLYMDGALTDGLTVSGPISPITLDTFEGAYRLLIGYMIGVSTEHLDLASVGICFTGSRIYLNISYFLHLIGSGEALARRSASTNTLMAEILLSTDLDRYRPAKPPALFRITNLIRHAPRIFWGARDIIRWSLKPLLNRARFRQEYDQALADFDTWLSRPVDHTETLCGSVLDGYTQVGITSLHSTGPALLYFVNAGTERVKRLINRKSPEQIALADALCRGYPDDQVVQMGLLMFDLSRLLPVSAFRDLAGLLEQIEDRQLPTTFLTAWNEFLGEYGCRGPLEMELANPGYAEAPLLALQQIATIALSGQDFDPHRMQRKLVEERERAYAALSTILPRRKRKRLARAYRNIVDYAGSRELVKHHVMQVNERLRSRLLYLADGFIRDDRLDSRSQIFELTMAEIDRGTSEVDFDLRHAAEIRGVPYRKLKAQVRHFPMAIDSRGRIQRPESKLEDGALVGSGVSPGIARGLVKVLNDPFEKEVLPGEVLVAVTTDPGWTPLFINASALLLEIGGELQHGALVAREYGKPCVTGIADVINRLRDGQLVEVDGNAGTVRILEEAPSPLQENATLTT